MLKLIAIQASNAKIVTNVPNNAAKPTILGAMNVNSWANPASADADEDRRAQDRPPRDVVHGHEPVDERDDAHEQHERADRATRAGAGCGRPCRSHRRRGPCPAPHERRSR